MQQKAFHFGLWVLLHQDSKSATRLKRFETLAKELSLRPEPLNSISPSATVSALSYAVPCVRLSAIECMFDSQSTKRGNPHMRSHSHVIR